MSTAVSIPKDVFASSIKASNEKAFRPSSRVLGTSATTKNIASSNKTQESSKSKDKK